MFCQMSISPDSFTRLIKYRIADLFRPLEAPVDFPENARSWLDGALVTQINYNRIENDHFVIINEIKAPDSLGPNLNGFGYSANAVSMDLAANIYFVRVEDVATAGLNQPPVHIERVPFGPIHITMRMSISEAGIPQLQMTLDTARLNGLGLPDGVVASIEAAGTANFPFDISNQFKGMFPPRQNRVLNVGVTLDDDGAIVLRFEFPDEQNRSAIVRRNDWHAFFSAGFRANLGNDDWSMDLDGDLIASQMADTINPSFKNDSHVDFDPRVHGGFIGDTPPRVAVIKHGSFLHACVGNSIRFDAFVNIDFTVPEVNLLRGVVSFDYTKDGWDTARCVAAMTLTPFSILATAIDNKGFGYGLLIELTLFPFKGLLIIAALFLLLAGVDKALADDIIDDRLKDEPKITKLPDGGFSFDQAVELKNAFTKDWLVLQRCTGSGTRLVLSGSLRVPDAVLPQLSASELEGFLNWVLIDSCSPGKGQTTKGSIVLSTLPGYGAEIASVQPVKSPTIPLKWGAHLYEVLNDELGIYQDAQSGYNQIYVPGIPGIVEVKLEGSTLRKPKFTNSPFFGSFPYPLRLRFFTNGGVREYEFKAPPKFKEYSETPATAIARISNCYRRGSSLVLKKYLQLKWLVDPPFEHRSGSQQWEIYISGLKTGRKVTVWNQDTSKPLVRAFADLTGKIDVSMVLGKNEQANTLLIGLDEEPFLDAKDIGQLFLHHAPETSLTAVDVIIRQTMLTEIDHLELSEPIESLHLVNAGIYCSLVVSSTLGRQFAYSIPTPYSPGLATPTRAPVIRIAKEDAHFGLATWRGTNRQFMVLSRGTERTEVLAEYSARSSHDLAAEEGHLFAQVSSDSRRIILFQKSVPVVLGPHEWKEGKSC